MKAESGTAPCIGMATSKKRRSRRRRCRPAEESWLLEAVDLEGDEQESQREQQHRKAAHVGFRTLDARVERLYLWGGYGCSYG